MYLAVAVIEASPEPGDALALQRAIQASRAPSDRVEHVCVERKDNRVLVALYLFGTDPLDARQAADQLCRRALVTWRGATWQLRSCAAKLIGPTQPAGPPPR